MCHVCSKQVQKDSSPEGEEEEQASPLREHRQKRCCCHQDGGRGRVDGRLQEDEGGGSPEDGYVLEDTAVQPPW